MLLLSIFQSSLSLGSTWSTWWSLSRASLEIGTRSKQREVTIYIYSYDDDDIGRSNDVDVEKCFLAGGREREWTPCGAVVADCCVLSSPDLLKRWSFYFMVIWYFMFFVGIASSPTLPPRSPNKEHISKIWVLVERILYQILWILNRWKLKNHFKRLKDFNGPIPTFAWHLFGRVSILCESVIPTLYLWVTDWQSCYGFRTNLEYFVFLQRVVLGLMVKQGQMYKVKQGQVFCIIARVVFDLMVKQDFWKAQVFSKLYFNKNNPDYPEVVWIYHHHHPHSLSHLSSR